MQALDSDTVTPNFSSAAPVGTCSTTLNIPKERIKGPKSQN